MSIHLLFFLDLAIVFMETIVSAFITFRGADLMIVELKAKKSIEKLLFKIKAF